MRFLKFIVLLIIAALIFYAMEMGIPPTLPPLGKFLSPATGFWQNAESKELSYPSSLKIEGLQDVVEVVYDDRLVPHIFAKNNHDLYFAQGYVTAQHRLWQMEFQTHFAAGRISEIVGEKALKLDRMNRRKGLMFAAENALKEFENDALTNELLQAYTDGINAWIGKLEYKDYPLEYKFLNYSPEPWSKLKSTLLLKYMADMLTGKSYDIEYSNMISILGEENIALLFPDYKDTLTDPIIPLNTVFPPGRFDLDTPRTAGLYNMFPVETERGEKNVGSNNWAVNGSKTRSGAPILCNDPHLQLNLPSIWYEIQLSAPGLNTYGVSLPGAPAIIIGFNSDISWGVTNGTQDVKDWYKVKFRDESMKEYWFDGEWLPTTSRIETIRIKGGGTYADTVYYTHFGPVVYTGSMVTDTSVANLACRWTGHDPSNEMIAFHHLNRAKNYTEYVAALRHFTSPGQNFVFASASGDIAIWQQGKFPLKWPLQGKFVMDGSSSVYQWQGFIPQEENPHVLNPERNFVSSANQHPTGGAYPYYYNGAFEYYRNRRINERLGMMQDITAEDMMKLQNDNMNLQASESLPMMLRLLDKAKINPGNQVYVAELEKWNYFNDANSTAAPVYENWWLVLDSLVWDELWAAKGMIDFPSEFNTVRLMRYFPEHALFDDRSTKDKAETLADLVNASFGIACQQLDRMKAGGDLTWSRYKKTSVEHLTQLRSLSVLNIPIGGNKRIVNACSNRWGPSWRMIVSMEKPVKAYGVYPGGQSGNPASHFYTTGIDKWARGEYFELLFMDGAAQEDARIMLKQTLHN